MTPLYPQMYGAMARPNEMPPIAGTEADNDRMRDAYMKRCLLEGMWTFLLQQHALVQLGPLRARLIGLADIGSNLFKSVNDQVSTTYDTEPRIAGPDGGLVADALEAVGWWQLAQRHERNVRGLLDSCVVLGWDPDAGTLVPELVTPDHVYVETAPANPNRVIRFWRARKRQVPTRRTDEAWFWDCWDISDPANPSFTIKSNDRAADLTRDFGIDPAEWSGAPYPYRNDEGKPIIPAVTYHSLPTTRPWSPNHQLEIVFGTLQVGLLWTATVHGFLRASWDQRVLLNGKLAGGTTQTVDGTGGRNIETHTPDPTSVMVVRGEGATIDSWGASIDIEKAEGVCRRYEARLAVHFGLSPADLVIESLNPASGASISVSSRGKRILQARSAPQFRRGDRELFSVAAAVLRGHGQARAVGIGWTARYSGVALTPEERTAVLGYVERERKADLLSRTDAYIELHPGVTVDEAEEALALLDAEKDLAATQAALVAKMQDTALQGQQLAAAQALVESCVAGKIPRISAKSMLMRGFGLDDATAENWLGPVDFIAEEPDPAPPPVSPAPPVADPAAEPSPAA